jgi:hypothetical protein
MIRPASQRHSSTVLQLRRLLIRHDHARRRAALDNRLDEQSTPHNVGSAYRDRPTEFAIPSTASQRPSQRTSATDRQRRNLHSV